MLGCRVEQQRQFWEIICRIKMMKLIDTKWHPTLIVFLIVISLNEIPLSNSEYRLLIDSFSLSTKRWILRLKILNYSGINNNYYDSILLLWNIIFYSFYKIVLFVCFCVLLCVLPCKATVFLCEFIFSNIFKDRSVMQLLVWTKDIYYEILKNSFQIFTKDKSNEINT